MAWAQNMGYNAQPKTQPNSKRPQNVMLEYQPVWQRPNTLCPQPLAPIARRLWLGWSSNKVRHSPTIIRYAHYSVQLFQNLSWDAHEGFLFPKKNLLPIRKRCVYILSAYIYKRTHISRLIPPIVETLIIRHSPNNQQDTLAPNNQQDILASK